MVIHNATQFIGLIFMLIGAAGIGHCFQQFVNPEE
jgi:hypothetical protein